MFKFWRCSHSFAWDARELSHFSNYSCWFNASLVWHFPKVNLRLPMNSCQPKINRYFSVDPLLNYCNTWANLISQHYFAFSYNISLKHDSALMWDFQALTAQSGGGWVFVWEKWRLLMRDFTLGAEFESSEEVPMPESLVPWPSNRTVFLRLRSIKALGPSRLSVTTAVRTLCNNNQQQQQYNTTTLHKAEKRMREENWNEMEKRRNQKGFQQRRSEKYGTKVKTFGSGRYRNWFSCIFTCFICRTELLGHEERRSPGVHYSHNDLSVWWWFFKILVIPNVWWYLMPNCTALFFCCSNFLR